MKNKRAPEIIATHLGFDLAEMKDYSYQPGKYKCALYTVGDWYYAAPTAKSMLPAERTWHPVAVEFGRQIYRSHMNSDVEA